MNENRSSRRAFLSRSAVGAACVGGAGRAIAAVTAVEEPQTTARFVSGLKQPRKVAVSDDGVFVAGDCEIRKFSIDGKQLDRFALKRPARCVTLESVSGHVLVGLMRTVVRLDAKGKELARWSAPENAILSSLAVWKGHVLGADAAAGVIWKWSSDDGELVGKIEKKSRFLTPVEFFHMVIAGDTLHVNNPGRHRLERFNNAGRQVGQWGRASRDVEGFAGCCNPVSFAVLADGSFVTAERGSPRVKLFDANGGFRSLLLGPDDFPQNLEASVRDQQPQCRAGGLDVAAWEGRIVVLDRVTGEIRVVKM